jgi:DNA invertase Pin-like site-specific DNA recombinase
LRASTEDQDASRARADLNRFASERGLAVAAYYVENESGAKLHRPELFRLLSDCSPGDLLLVEQVDRLSRLGTGDWDALKAEIAARHVRVVALDLPTSWLMAHGETDAFTESAAAADAWPHIRRARPTRPCKGGLSTPGKCSRSATP